MAISPRAYKIAAQSNWGFLCSSLAGERGGEDGRIREGFGGEGRRVEERRREEEEEEGRRGGGEEKEEEQENTGGRGEKRKGEDRETASL